MRKIHFGEETWQYQIGRSNIEIKSPDNDKFVVALTYFLVEEMGESTASAHRIVFPSHFDDRASLPPIKPSNIKNFIQNQIKDNEDISGSCHIR